MVAVDIMVKAIVGEAEFIEADEVTYRRTEDGELHIFTQNKSDDAPRLAAVFNTWFYFLIRY